MYELPLLPYEYASLEPFIDRKTMEIHHGKHHATYVENLNIAMKNYPDLANKPIEDIIQHVDNIPNDIRTQVINHGGGHANHSFFWLCLAPNTTQNIEPVGTSKQAIIATFGSIEFFKEQFKKSALTRFGSGWAWLVLQNGKLDIVSTANQDSPLTLRMTPLLCIDVWEHAYYLSYQNRRADYIDAFWNIVSWEAVENRLVSHLGHA